MKELLTKLLRPFRQLVTGLDNLIHYFPLIWADRQWDDYFMWKFLHAKLARMQDFYSDERNYDSEDNGRFASIYEARSLCERLMHNRYEDEALEEHYSKFGNVDAVFSDAGNGMKKLSFIQENVKTELDEKLADEDFQNRLAEADADRKNDINDLCTILKYDSRGWWD